MLKFGSKYLQIKVIFQIKTFPLPHILAYNEIPLQLIWHVMRGEGARYYMIAKPVIKRSYRIMREEKCKCMEVGNLLIGH